MRVIAVVGWPGSGKTEAAAIADEMGLPVVTMGDVIRDEVERQGLEPTDENMGSVATKVREEEGMDAFASRCVDQVRESDSDSVFIDGVRGWSEAKRFRDEFGDGFTLIAIEAPFEERFNRISERGRSDDFESPEELRRRDEREEGYGMTEAIENADEVVVNDADLEGFRDEIRLILKEKVNEKV